MFVTADGGLTTAGYAVFIVAAIAILLVASFLIGRKKEENFSAKKLTFCAVCLALAFALSYIRLFRMPWGGAVTLCSMLLVILTAYWYGAGTGILVGIVYGIMQFIQEPYFLSFPQVCLDYLFAFGALGIAGFFAKKKHGLQIGYLAGVFGRGVFASLAGYVFWLDYMPENFPRSLAAIYPIAYNYAYLLAEAALTLIIISIPAVKNGLTQVKRFAQQ